MRTLPRRHDLLFQMNINFRCTVHPELKRRFLLPVACDANQLTIETASLAFLRINSFGSEFLRGSFVYSQSLFASRKSADRRRKVSGVVEGFVGFRRQRPL